MARGRLESVSAWVNEALRAKAEHERRLDALGEFVAAYEHEHGEITPEEMRAAARRARPGGVAASVKRGRARPSRRASRR